MTRPVRRVALATVASTLVAAPTAAFNSGGLGILHAASIKAVDGGSTGFRGDDLNEWRPLIRLS